MSWGVSVTRQEIAPTTSVVTGTITVTVPGPGVLNVTVSGTGGNCSDPVCPIGVVGPGTVVCNITCTAGTTSVTPTVVVDDTPPRTSTPIFINYVTVKGPTQCINVDNPFLAQYGPTTVRGAWARRRLCDFDTDTTVTRTTVVSTTPPPPSAGQCLTCEATYLVTATTVITSNITGAFIANGSGTAPWSCPGYSAPSCTVTARNDSYAGTWNTPLPVPSGSGMLANDSSGAASPRLEVTSVGAPGRGTLSSWSPNGSFVFQPDTNWFGTTLFPYSIIDRSNNRTASAFVHIVVPSPGAGAPRDDVYACAYGAACSPASAGAPGVLDNDRSLTGCPINMSGLVTPPAQGSVTLAQSGDFTYTPASP
jgi:hypothetical protein